MKQVFKIDKRVAKEIQGFLNKDTPVPNSGHCEVLRTFTVDFGKGIEADIKWCNGDTGSWIDSVLFNNGHEVQVLEPSDIILGEYPFEYNNKKYTVDVTIAVM